MDRRPVNEAGVALSDPACDMAHSGQHPGRAHDHIIAATIPPAADKGVDRAGALCGGCRPIDPHFIALSAILIVITLLNTIESSEATSPGFNRGARAPE
jgi:hypothetical protein